MTNTAKSIVCLIVALTAATIAASAQEIVRKKDLKPDSIEQVIVGKDTVDVILPQRNLGRFDRGLRNYMFIPKGKWGLGLTASYGEFGSKDLQMLNVMKDFDFNGKIYSIKPSVQYFIRSNDAVGVKFNYSHGIAEVKSLAIDVDDDLNFEIKDVSYRQDSFATSLFYRSYIGLSNSGRFGIFNETDLTFGMGTSRFKRPYNNIMRDTRTTSTEISLNFSPGVCVFIQDFLAFNVSFGVFGLQYKHEHQETNGYSDGTRNSSGANFRFNIFNINFGLMVVI